MKLNMTFATANTRKTTNVKRSIRASVCWTQDLLLINAVNKSAKKRCSAGVENYIKKKYFNARRLHRNELLIFEWFICSFRKSIFCASWVASVSILSHWPYGKEDRKWYYNKSKFYSEAKKIVQNFKCRKKKLSEIGTFEYVCTMQWILR